MGLWKQRALCQQQQQASNQIAGSSHTSHNLHTFWTGRDLERFCNLVHERGVHWGQVQPLVTASSDKPSRWKAVILGVSTSPVTAWAGNGIVHLQARHGEDGSFSTDRVWCRESLGRLYAHGTRIHLSLSPFEMR